MFHIYVTNHGFEPITVLEFVFFLL